MPLVILELSVVLVAVIPAVVPVALLFPELPLSLVQLSIGGPSENTVAVLDILHVLPDVGVAICKLICSITFLHVVLEFTPVGVAVLIGNLDAAM